MSASSLPAPFNVCNGVENGMLEIRPESVVPRYKLPLDAITTYGDITTQKTRPFFVANLPDFGSAHALIARVDGTGLVAIEKVGESLYSSTNVESWATAISCSLKASYLPHSNILKPSDDSEPWWKAAVIDGANAKAPRTPKSESKLSSDALRTLGQQYLDALYISKTSLAFFVKGPLSRARARAIALSDDGTALRELVDYYRCLILSNNQMEKKYKDKIFEVAKEFVNTEQSPGADDVEAKQKPARLRKTKTIKPGKDGLYPKEGELIVRWLTAVEATDDEALVPHIESLLKSRLPQLRFREQLIQLVLILEILAIEKKDLSEPSQIPIAKTKKTKDLNSMLEMLVDRLCIWQSLHSSHNNGILEKEADEHSQADPRSSETPGTASKDHLKDFGIEVIVPFYSARLPDIVDTLSLKFGVKTKVVPSKRKPPAKHSLDSPEANKSVERDAANKARRLQRTSSVASHASTSAPIPLSRSSTDSFLEGIVKRERSATPQPHLTSKLDRRPFSRSSSISQSRSFSQREVDFSMINKAKEQKTQKKARIEEEVKNAISALRKPNRSLVSQEYFDGVQVNATPKKVRGGKAQTQPPSFHFPLNDSATTINSTPAARTSAITATPAKQRSSDMLSTVQVGFPMASPEAQRVASTPSISRKIPSTPAKRDTIADTPIKITR